MPRIAVLVVATLAACRHDAGPPLVPADMLAGRPTAPSADAAATPTPAPAEPAGALTAEAACARLATLAGEHCAWTERFPPELHDPATCARSLATWFAPETPQHEQLEQTVACWARACDAAAACMVQQAAGAAPPPPRACGETGTGAVIADAATWARRPGAQAVHFADVASSEAAPIEVCGIREEVEWMTRVTCKDGTNPYGSLDAANDARDSWLARGGRCNSVLDRYSVRCPERTYPVFVDRYVCPAPPAE